MENSPVRAFEVGSVIADTYTIEALIGRGGMGAVYRASHKRLPGKKVAIKVLHAELADDEVLARFKREAEIAASLGHPNIVGITDFNVLPDGTPYLVLELLEGETLAQRLRRGPLTLDHVMAIIRQVGSALAAAHRLGIVHRDLKPQNIFLVPSELDGRHGEVAKILDFGISKIRGSETVKTQEATLLGTPQYMAPEQATGQHTTIDERTDIFALGAIVYEMLTGQPAFSGQSIPEVVFKVVYEQPASLAAQLPTLPDGVVGAVTQAMAKPAAERFATVGGFVEALTGSPLAVRDRSPAAPPPEVGWATGSRKVTPEEALAHTVDSGRHPPVRASTPTVASLAGVGDAATMMGPPTGSGIATGGGPGAPTAPAAPVTQVSPPGGATAAPGRGRGGVIALVVGAAVIAGAAVFLLTRPPRAVAPPVIADRGADHGSAAAVVTDAGAEARDVPGRDGASALGAVAPPVDALAAPPVDAPAAPPPPPPSVDAGAPRPALRPDAGAPRVAHADAGVAHDKVVVPPVDGTSDGEDGDLKKALAEAQAAIATNPGLANRLANRVASSGSPRLRALAQTVKGEVACGKNDQDGAMTALRSLADLGRFPLMRQRVIKACAEHGTTLVDPP